jgi:ferredoxin
LISEGCTGCAICAIVCPEAAEIEDAQKGALQPQFSEEKLKRDLDESRFENL